MSPFEASPEQLERIRQEFNRMGLTKTLKASLTRLEPGLVEVEMPFSTAITQQRGFAHAGAITTILDTACGFAAGSLMPLGSDVLSIEFKLNFLSPAVGSRFRAVGRVTRAGRTITVTQGEAFAVQDGQDKPIALMLATMMRVDGLT